MITNAEPQPAGREDLQPCADAVEVHPQTNILWLKLTDAASNTSWFPIHLNQFPSQSTTPAQPDLSTDFCA
jgi:hypothetical protein